MYGEYRAAMEQLNQLLSTGAARDVELKQKTSQLDQARAALVALESELNKMETSQISGATTINHLQVDLAKMNEKHEQQQAEKTMLIESLTTGLKIKKLLAFFWVALFSLLAGCY